MSLIFTDWQWIKIKYRKVSDPYKMLLKMLQDITDKDMDNLSDDEAALKAYARMQIEEMSNYERDEIRKALLKYCELDTRSIVKFYEGWKDLVQQEQQN